jgi:integrase
MNVKGEFAFPHYTVKDYCYTNSASAALNKWLKSKIHNNYVIHSFRHSMRDRLRAVNCPSEMIDQIGGWSNTNVGSKYGKGYNLIELDKILKLI